MEGAGAGVECLLILPGNAGNTVATFCLYCLMRQGGTVAGACFLLVKSEK